MEPAEGGSVIPLCKTHGCGRHARIGGHCAVHGHIVQDRPEADMDRPALALHIKDSGVREEFSTGSRRDTREGKGRFDLLPWDVIEQDAKFVEAGARKYGDRNWEKGQSLSRYMDSAMRHLCKHNMGMRDEPHLLACRWNIAAFLWTLERIREGKLPAELDDIGELTR